MLSSPKTHDVTRADQDLRDFPLEKADLCVKCGLCLPHCPTYQLTQNEADSPRGRIALMQGMSNGLIEATPTVEQHLDGCLGCRSCESVCPAQVPYGALIDAGRASLHKQQETRNSWLQRLAPWLLSTRGRLLARKSLRLYQLSGLQSLLRLILPRDSRLGRMVAMLPPITNPPARGQYSSGDTNSRSVQLFSGCVSELTDAQALQDAIYVLNRCGFDVELPQGQGCCGALHQHAGMRAEAQQAFSQNLAAFGDNTQAIIGTATGCTAMLREYDQYADDEEAQHFASRVIDINAFVARNWPENLKVAALTARVAVQEPCSLRNVLGGGESVHAVLRHIPQLEVQALAGNTQCCGAAGSMMITAAKQADALAEHKWAAIAASQPDYLVSSNVGCAMHLAGGLRRANSTTEVIHPISLLARQLRLAEA